MRVHRLSNGSTRSFAVVLDTGDEAVRELTRFAVEAGIDGAQLTAVGAFRSARIGWFDLDAQDYRPTDVRQQAEVLSLVGDITFADLEMSERKVHAHVVLGLPDGRTLGGHLLAGHVRPTLEVIVNETPSALRRRFDRRTGLALIDLSAPRGGPSGAPAETPLALDPLSASAAADALLPGDSDGSNRR